MVRLTASTWVLTFCLSKPILWTSNYEKYYRCYNLYPRNTIGEEKRREYDTNLCSSVELKLFKNVYIKDLRLPH